MIGLSMNRNNTLLFFIKPPIPGQVKTRFQPELSAEESLLFYKTLVIDQLKCIKQDNNYDFNIFYSPPNPDNLLQKWLGNDLALHAQSGTDLGERMNHAFEWAFKQGYNKAVLVGSDIPFITSATIKQAFLKLDQYDVIIGPSTDGGYYLMGLKKSDVDLFKNKSWSTERVFAQTMDVINQKKLTVYKLEKKYDIDTYEDLLKFYNDLSLSKTDNTYFNYQKTFNIIRQIVS